ncbi:MAG TPA: type II toxin-antitoxin system HipA family toxin [Rhizomicrobium sp.]|jgi:serine/threonine-protein kinase HipA|nr:type II toxin-antitoxin system HipA family toxin [Rhizomicrobium sp.]
MALHLVGETLNKSQSYQQAESGKLVQLQRGIYVDAGNDIDAIVLKHAIRIARYLYPNAYLSAASALLLAPTRDGRLFISGRRIQRTRLRSLEIIQNTAPAKPSVASAVVADDMGEFRVDVSSLRQRFLEAFRLRSEHAASIDPAMREALAQRLIEEYGSAKAAADALWSLARENDWYREGEAAERFLQSNPSAVAVKNEAVLDLIVAWHGRPIGHLRHDGFEWRWTSIDNGGPPLIRQTTPGKLPPFITSLLPEGWLETVLKDRDERALLRTGKRYMSNITIVEHEAELAKLPQDILGPRLADHTKGGVFAGHYAGPGRGDLEHSFERNLARIFERADVPRISGIQMKAPMNLNPNGVLAPSVGTPFTHILKPAGTSGYDAVPVVEWLAMTLGAASGFIAPATALVAMPDGMPPALVVERFDIRTSETDTRLLAMEDFCSVLRLPPEEKYDSTMERAMRAVRPLSTAPDDDLKTILCRALFSWLIADGDMHLKNMALLKAGQAENTAFLSVRVAPLYDAVTTRVFPNLRHDHLALKLNGKDDRLRRADFAALAANAGLKAGDANAAIDGVLEKLAQAVQTISLPPSLEYPPAFEKITAEAISLCTARIAQFS